MRQLGCEDFDRIRFGHGANYKTPADKVSKGREAIRLLVQRGAMWKPDPSTLNATRRILYRLEPDVTVELLGRLLTQPNGEDAAPPLPPAPPTKQHVASCD